MKHDTRYHRYYWYDNIWEFTTANYLQLSYLLYFAQLSPLIERSPNLQTIDSPIIQIILGLYSLYISWTRISSWSAGSVVQTTSISHAGSFIRPRDHFLYKTYVLLPGLSRDVFVERSGACSFLMM